MNMHFADTLEVHSDWKLCILPLNTSHSACTHLPLTVKLLSHSSVLLMWAVGLIGLCYATQLITEWWNILGLNLLKQTPNLIRFEVLQMIHDIEFSMVAKQPLSFQHSCSLVLSKCDGAIASLPWGGHAHPEHHWASISPVYSDLSWAKRFNQQHFQRSNVNQALF